MTIQRMDACCGHLLTTIGLAGLYPEWASQINAIPAPGPSLALDHVMDTSVFPFTSIRELPCLVCRTDGEEPRRHRSVQLHYVPSAFGADRLLSGTRGCVPSRATVGQ